MSSALSCEGKSELVQNLATRFKVALVFREELLCTNRNIFHSNPVHPAYPLAMCSEDAYGEITV